MRILHFPRFYMIFAIFLFGVTLGMCMMPGAMQRVPDIVIVLALSIAIFSYSLWLEEKMYHG